MKTINKLNRSAMVLSEAGNAFLQFIILFLPLIIIAYYIKSSNSFLSNFLMLFSGWLAWTFIEYCNHRFRMHESANPSRVIGYELHMMHHHHPTEIKITVAQRSLLLTGNMVLIVFCVFNNSWIFLVTGLYSGFAIYTLMHWFLHRKISAKLFPEIHQFHIHHHCKHPDKCFGITVTWWDHLFNTIPQQQKEITDRIKAFYYKE